MHTCKWSAQLYMRNWSSINLNNPHTWGRDSHFNPIAHIANNKNISHAHTRSFNLLISLGLLATRLVGYPCLLEDISNTSWKNRLQVCVHALLHLWLILQVSVCSVLMRHLRPETMPCACMPLCACVLLMCRLLRKEHIYKTDGDTETLHLWQIYKDMTSVVG